MIFFFSELKKEHLKKKVKKNEAENLVRDLNEIMCWNESRYERNSEVPLLPFFPHNSAED